MEVGSLECRQWHSDQSGARRPPRRRVTIHLYEEGPHRDTAGNPAQEGRAQGLLSEHRRSGRRSAIAATWFYTTRGSDPRSGSTTERGLPKGSRRFQPDVSACQLCRLRSALSCPLPSVALCPTSYCQVISAGPMRAGAIVLLPLYVTRQPMTHGTLTKSMPANASPVFGLSPMSISRSQRAEPSVHRALGAAPPLVPVVGDTPFHLHTSKSADPSVARRWLLSSTWTLTNRCEPAPTGRVVTS